MPEQTDLTPADTPPPAVGVTRFICWPGRRRADGGRDTPRLVCLSSRESYVANVPSLLGIAEVIGAVWLYWWAIPAWFDTHWHLLVSVLIAPLLLLRSPASVEAALEALARYLSNRPPSSWGGGLIVVSSVVIALVFGYGLASACLPHHSGWGLIWRSMLIGWAAINAGIALAGAWTATVPSRAPVAIGAILKRALAWFPGHVTNVSAFRAVFALSMAFGVVVGVSIVPGILGGVLLRALTIKVDTTLRHLLDGWDRLPENWHRLVFAQDFHHPPEILPDIHTRAELSGLDAVRLLREFRLGDAQSRIGSAFLALIVIPPAWFYRLSLKSTFWFYWPLVFAQTHVRGIKISAKTLVKEHTSTLIGRRLALFAGALVFGALTPIWNWLGQFTVLTGIKAEHLYLVALLGDTALLALPAASVSLLLYVSADLLGPRADSGEISTAQIGWLKALIGVRWALVWSALLIGLLLFAGEAAREWTPLAILDLSTWLRTHYFGLFPGH